MSRPRPENRRGQPADPCALAIFGASGDLAKRKLFPALLNLKRSGLLPEEFAVLGLATSEMTSEAFRERLRGELHTSAAPETDGALVGWLLDRTYYVPSDFRSPELSGRVEEGIRGVESRHQ